MAVINYLAEGVEMPHLNRPRLERWIQSVTCLFGKKAGNLTYIFCDDDKILEVNRTYLQHDYYTDIITFDDSKRGIINGDMYISLDTVASNADSLGKDRVEELHRVIIHGVLHLCGVNDKAPGEREIMESHEDNALQILKGLENEV